MGKKWEAMEALFKPRAVAVIGASNNPGKLGSHVIRSLTEGGYRGRIYPVNPGSNEIMGIKTYPSLLQIPESVRFAEAVAGKVRILYGGSVRPDNAAEFLSQEDVDGVGVGRAGWKPDSFSKILDSVFAKITPARK